MVNKRIALDPLEEKAIFPISRIFYHLLVAVGGLGALGGLLLLVYSITPTLKVPVTQRPDPPPVTITAEIVKANLQPKAEAESSVPAKPSAKAEAVQLKKEEPQPSKDEQRLQAALEKLKDLLPDAKYKWESVRVFIRPQSFFQQGEWRTTYLGIEKRLRDLISLYDSPVRQAEVLESLAVVLAQFDEANRLEPVKAFIKLQRDAEKARQVEMRKNQSEYEAEGARSQAAYQRTELEKQLKRYQGLIVLGAGISSVAVLGIFLVLLSIQREVRKIASASSPSVPVG